MGSICLKGTEPLRGDSLLFTTMSPGGSGTHLTNLLKDDRLSLTWSDPVVLNLRPLDWESSSLTTRPLLQREILRGHF